MPPSDPSTELMRLINGYQVSQALHVAAMLGVADRMKDGPVSSDDLARLCGAHPRSLYRLLRALAAAGIFQESGKKEFSLTPLGICLTTEAPGSRASYARWVGTPGLWRSWGNLLHSIKLGENATQFTLGTDSWTYRDQHPDEQAIFNSAMTGNSRAEARAVIEAYDFTRFDRIVDIGGGHGLLLKEILRVCLAARGTLFDQPGVVASAVQDAAASAELAGRYQTIAGSFFESVPGDGDAYIMKLILHDWSDADAIRILQACRRAMSATASLVIIERVIGLPNEDVEGKLSDLNMLIQYAAQERTRSEFDDLLHRGGFALNEVVPTRSPLSIIVAKPMQAR